MTLINDLIEQTFSLTLFFVIGLLLAGVIAGAVGIRRNRIHLGLYDAGDLWRAWFLVMACGIGVAILSVATGLLATGIVMAIGRIISSATSVHFLDGFYSESSVSCTSFILGMFMIAAAGSLFGALAGVIQRSMLGRVISRPPDHWIMANILVWTGSLVTSTFLGIMLGSVAGSTGLNSVLFLGGLVAGGIAADRVMSAAVEQILHNQYQTHNELPSSLPWEPGRLGRLLKEGVALVILLAIVVGAISLMSIGGTRARSSRPVPTAVIRSDPQLTATPNTSAATYCSEVERKHPSDTYVCMGSEPGDPVASGGNWVMTKESSTFSQLYADGHNVVIRVVDGSDWDLSFAAPSKEQLQIVAYENAANFEANIEQATMHVRASNAFLQCSGSFQVLTYEYDSTASTIKRLAINFVQTCNDTGAKLYGIIRINISPGDLQ